MKALAAREPSQPTRPAAATAGMSATPMPAIYRSLSMSTPCTGEAEGADEQCASRSQERHPHGPAGLLNIPSSAGNHAETALIAARSALPSLPGGMTTRPLPSITPVRPSDDRRSPSAPVPPAVHRAGPAVSALFELGSAAQRLDRVARTSQPAHGVSVAAAAAISALGSGSPVPESASGPFERAYGHRLRPVRLHTGPMAARASAALGAQAITLGDHVLLGAGTDLSTEAGRFVLGHELAHVVQSRRSPATGTGHVSNPMQASEREATAAALAALQGRSTDLRESVSDDPQRIVWWVLALIGLGVGGAIAVTASATGHGVDENRERQVQEQRGTVEDVIAWIPIAGSVQDIWQAESNLQLALGIGFLAFDVATLGGTGVLVRALARVPGAALRVLARGAERAAESGVEHAAIRVAGEQVTEEALEQAVRQLGEHGGAVSAATATEEITRALSREGAMVFAMEGGHAVLYANRTGQILKLHGGPLVVRFATRELGEDAARAASHSVAGSQVEGGLSAYAIVSGGAPLTLEALERMPIGVAGALEAAGRLIFGNPTSCGIVQGAALEASGLTAEGLARLLPAGGASGRYFPITLVDQWLETGAGRLVEGGTARLMYGANGTVMQGAMAIFQVGGRLIAPGAMRQTANVALPITPRGGSDDGTASALAEIDAGTPAAGWDAEHAARLQWVAATIVSRWGRSPDPLAVTEIQQSLVDLIPGWLIMSASAQAPLRGFLRNAGMEPAAVDAVLGS